MGDPGDLRHRDLYGLEKLFGEVLVHRFANKLSIQISRFHNVYGARGTWYGRREKALEGKAVVAKWPNPQLIQAAKDGKRWLKSLSRRRNHSTTLLFITNM
ncbi:hypothetical protein E1B28_009301 [Marasmius oreades]|uniref:Uncharacterized protein n=1 Tax=Marasmius oreades TaxID=181124 RepID=A0A9P7USN9_9AGAR|nr:uncharacterized protein E1B28_009301 [Marasmius oreades]KAG7093002.1 hypothetical protein E1B28_009301 [Marasmius oreades]